MSFSEIDVAIVGAGPYGLSLATHLATRGVEHRIFGRAMRAWADMSPGMYLKSYVFATNVYPPQSGFDFTTYCRERGLESVEPAEIAEFARYGVWVQKQLVPYLEDTDVVAVARLNEGFEVRLASGEILRARRVVNAIGLTYFERLPKELRGLPLDYASHTTHHADFSPFRGRHVVVIGAGQSALQAAALLHEHGAEVEMCVRGDGVHFGFRVNDKERSRLQRLRVPISVLGHGRDNWLLEHFPMRMHYVQEEKRVAYTQTHLGPGGAWWLRDRVLGHFPLHSHVTLREALPNGRGLELRFAKADGEARVIHTDHIVAGTGYEVDVDKMTYLDPALAASVARIVRAPRLSRHFESSVPGLFFIGPSSAFSFGPLYRFVAGASYTTRVLSRRLGLTSNRSRSFSPAVSVQDEPTLATSRQR